MGKKRKTLGRKTLSNHEIVTLAVYLLGGNTEQIDTEDVAVKANEIAPARFTWRKYSDQINIENVRTFLSDAKKTKNGAYLTGTGKDGWMLTEVGVKFAQKRICDIEGARSATRPRSMRERKWMRSEHARMVSSDAFLKQKEKGIDAVTPQEAAGFFRLDEYVVGDARERKLVRTLNAFGSDPDLGPVVRELAKKLRKGPCYANVIAHNSR